MGKLVGIWLNNRKALIVSLAKGKEEENQTCESHATRHIRFSGEPKGISPDNAAETDDREDLKTHFKEVLEIVKDAKSILVFGPGKAKDNLKKALLETQELGKRIVAMEPAEKMTAKQIIAKVKDFYFPEMREKRQLDSN